MRTIRFIVLLIPVALLPFSRAQGLSAGEEGPLIPEAVASTVRAGMAIPGMSLRRIDLPCPDAATEAVQAPGSPGSESFVTAYWAGWDADRYPLASVNWSAVTHALVAFVLPRAPATPDPDNPYHTLQTAWIPGYSGPAGMAAFSSAAHAHGVKALFSLGGAGAGTGFAAAAGAGNRALFITEILAACAAWGYDGVDLDWEDNIVFADYKSLVQELRAAAPPGFVITAAIGFVNTNFGVSAEDEDLWGTVHPQMDQLNPMSYCGTGNWSGWVTWHFNPLFGHAGNHPVDVASTLEAWAGIGIPRSKLGVGIGFYSLGIGPPVTGVLQDYNGASVYGWDGDMFYGNVVRHFLNKGGATRQWDSVSKVPYLSWTSPFTPTATWQEQYGAGAVAPTVQFLSYEDAESIGAKGAWARANGYGGCMIWTINEGTMWPFGADGYANPLLDAVKTAFLTPPAAKPYDFNGDGCADLLWRHTASGALGDWYLTPSGATAGALTGNVSDLGWGVAAVGDFDRNGLGDLLWRHASSGDLVIWYINAAGYAGSLPLGAVSTAWKIQGAADVNGDAVSDLLWRDDSSGNLAVWLMSTAGVSGSLFAGGIGDTGWKVLGTGDVNGDGKADVLWRHAASGTLSIWFETEAGYAGSASPGTVSTDWKVAGFGDLNADGTADLLWIHPSTGDLSAWLLTPGGAAGSSVYLGRVTDAQWKVKGLQDFNGDGRADLLWRHAGSGAAVVWYLSASGVSGQLYLGTVNTAWQTVNQANFPGASELP